MHLDQFLQNLLTDTSGALAYALIFGVLLACGMGVPLPEDVSLILGGYLAHTGSVKLPLMIAVCFVGILTGDSLIFFAGRRIGSRVGSKPGFFSRIVTPEKRVKVESLFHRHGEKIVMISRFLPGVRAVTYFTAGSAGIRYWHFILWDGLAALVSVPLLVYLGFLFGGELETLVRRIRDGQLAVLLFVVALGIAWVVYRRWRIKRDVVQAEKLVREDPTISEEAKEQLAHRQDHLPAE